VSNILHIRSPVLSKGTIVDRGYNRIIAMSIEAWFRCSVNDTLRNRIVYRKNSTVS
jgi:hypothetical protein